MKILKNRLGGWVGTMFPLYCDYENGMKISDWGGEDGINDEVLGKVDDATNLINKKKKQEKEKDEDDDSIEDL